MKFSDLFRDSNDINEKSVVGFASFAVMVIFAAADIVTGILGQHFVISDTIFNSFVIITLGSFGIASVDKYINRKAEHDKNKLDAGAEEELG